MVFLEHVEINLSYVLAALDDLHNVGVGDLEVRGIDEIENGRHSLHGELGNVHKRDPF